MAQQPKAAAASKAKRKKATASESAVLLDAALRSDLVAFIDKCGQTLIGDDYLPNWHIEAMAHRLEQCLSGECRRLGIFLPPRNGKSMVTSIAFPAFALGHDPKLRIAVASHSMDLAIALARDFRTIIESDWYRRIFPQVRADPKKDTEGEFVTHQGGGRVSLSVGKSFTGRGADLIIVDDPMSADLANSESEETKVKTWYDKLLSTRLNNKKTGVIILTMQRLSVGDLAGHVLPDGGWDVLCLPAIATKSETIALGAERVFEREQTDLLHEDREDDAVLDEMRTRLGEAGFSAQYQQAPIPPGGGMLRWEWFRRYRALPAVERHEMILHAWDTAASLEVGTSFSVFQKWVLVERRWFLTEQIRKRMQYPELRKLALSLIKRDNPDHVLIEFASTGQALAQEVFHHYPLHERKKRVPTLKPKAGKSERAALVTPLIEEGRVILPLDVDFLPAFETEVRAFPDGKTDDQVDAMVWALWFYLNAYEWKYRPRAYTIGGGRRPG